MKNYDSLDEEYLKEALHGDQIIIVSYGGVHEYQGNFGGVISNGTEHVATNYGKIYSVEFMASPYRSELYSMLAGIMTLKYITQNDISNKEIILYSDCKALVKKVQYQSKWEMTVNQHRGPDADLEIQLLYEIKQLLKKMNTISCRYVRGHQELKKLKTDLKHEEQLNIMADQFTKRARHLSNIKKYQSLPTNNVNIIVNNDVINSKYRQITTRCYHSIPLRSYLKKIYKWKDSTISSIWWKGYHKSMEKLDSTDKLRIKKFIHDRLPTKYRDNLYYKYKPAECSTCKCGVENEDHIMKCQTSARKDIRTTWLEEVKSFLNSTAPDAVAKAIYNGLHQWLEPISIDIMYDISEDELWIDEVEKAVKTQNDIGWRNMIRGRLAIEWRDIMDSYIKHKKITKYNAEEWGSTLNEINWKNILSMWQLRKEQVNGKTEQEQQATKKLKMIEELTYWLKTIYDMNNGNDGNSD